MTLEFRITGVVREQESGKALPNLLIRAYDKDLIYDDLLGDATTNTSGEFEMRYTGDDFKELFEQHPDIYLDILDSSGVHVLYSTENAIRWNAEASEIFDIVIPQHKIPPPAELTLELSPVGPDQATIDAALFRLLQHASVQSYLKDTHYRILSVELIEPDEKTSEPTLSDRYRATIYDYTHNRTLVAIGSLDQDECLEVSELAIQPLPNYEEFEAAVKILQHDRELGTVIRENLLQPYQPMPPVIEEELPDGRVERIIAVGLLPRNSKLPHEIVGVNMTRQTITRFEGRSPHFTDAGDRICGLPHANQATVSRGTAGQINVTVTQGGTTLWTFQVIRPAVSSGTNGSGIELRYVNYRGKRVLYRAHVPILNVRYDNDACGPYRDWQWQEGMLQANGTDVAPGFRQCPTPAQTILDTKNDAGNYLGTAIYLQGQEVVLVNEMQAGWYRYISEWRLHANGTIYPRFGFTAVDTSSCVCNRHHHHVYWRLDFDIRTAGDNIVQEYNNPPLFPPSNWHTKYYEIRRSRDASRRRRWRVMNASTGEGYILIPGAEDGEADSFGVGDVWVLRYRSSEIDDGEGFTTDPTRAMAHIDNFRNGESVNGQDVVIWYAAHFTHAVGSEGEVGHIVGPTLRPFNW